MKVSELPYPLRLVVETMHYCTFTNPITQDIKCSELKAALVALYGESLVEDSLRALRGEYTGTDKPIAKQATCGKV